MEDSSHPFQDLTTVLKELSAREPIFHRPEFGTSRTDFELMTTSEFWEVGASGKYYDRKRVLDILESRYSKAFADVWETFDFQCQELARDLYLLTYKLLQDERRWTHRTTIWARTTQGWKIVFHQGTILQEPPDGKSGAPKPP